MKNRLLFYFILLCAGNLAAQTLPFSRETFDQWVDMRIGDGTKDVLWYCYGEVYTYPDGKLLTKMEGVDVARMTRFSPDSVMQLNRKIFVYTDKNTGAVLTEYEGKPVTHIEYPYQMVNYVLKGDKMAAYVEQGKAPRITKLGPGYSTMARKLGKTLMFSTPVFLNFPTPRGQYEAYENYDFFVNYQRNRTQDRYQLVWNRFGDLPPFLGGGKGIIQLVAHRVDSFEDLTPVLKKHIREKAPLWLKAPSNIEEIRRLQQ